MTSTACCARASYMLVCTVRTERRVATWEKDEGAGDRGVQSQGRQAQEGEGGALLRHRVVAGTAGRSMGPADMMPAALRRMGERRPKALVFPAFRPAHLLGSHWQCGMRGLPWHDLAARSGSSSAASPLPCAAADPRGPGVVPCRATVTRLVQGIAPASKRPPVHMLARVHPLTPPAHTSTRSSNGPARGGRLCAAVLVRCVRFTAAMTAPAHPSATPPAPPNHTGRRGRIGHGGESAMAALEGGLEACQA